MSDAVETVDVGGSALKGFAIECCCADEAFAGVVVADVAADGEFLGEEE